MEPATVGTSFHDYFQARLATTLKEREAAYRLRYAVYCREFGYEREEDCVNGMERNGYEEQAIHCLLVHKATNTTAGCVRLVLTEPGHPDRPLPFEKACGHSLDRERMDPAAMPRDRIGEISRLAVHSCFRRRSHENEFPAGLPRFHRISASERRHFPYLSLGLYLAAAAIGLLAGLEGVFAMMEPRLARHLVRYGIGFEQVGALIDYHGPRAPFYISRDMLLANLKPETRVLLETVREDLEPQAQRARLVRVH